MAVTQVKDPSFMELIPTIEPASLLSVRWPIIVERSVMKSELSSMVVRKIAYLNYIAYEY